MKIATVVVTFNRLELLKECICSLKEQTRKIDEIFVINNSSTDGTEEWLNKQKDITTITQPNSGGAGGFYTGIKTAYEIGYDWIWVMDDDGLPLKNTLEELFKHANSFVGVLNSLVVSKSNENELVFGIEDLILKESYSSVLEVKDKEYINGANFFNGTMLHREVIKRIGLPQPMFFIYGDEYEYYLRIKSNEITIKTITTSIILHPEQKNKYIGKGKFLHRFNDFNNLRVRHFPPNIIVICCLYEEFTLKRLIKIYLMDIYGLLFYDKKIKFAIKYLLYSSTAYSLFKKLNINK